MKAASPQSLSGAGLRFNHPADRPELLTPMADGSMHHQVDEAALRQPEVLLYR